MKVIKSEYSRHSFESDNKPSIENGHGRIVRINFIEIHPTVIRLKRPDIKKIICQKIAEELVVKYSGKVIYANLNDLDIFSEKLWIEVDGSKIQTHLQIQLILDENIYLLKVLAVT